MSTILKIDNLWGGYTNDVDILRGISLEVNKGETLGIIGLNGSGKSTFGKAIMNMIPIRRGSIELAGQHIENLSTHQLSRHGLAIMQQGGQVFQTMTVLENLELAFGTKKNSQYKDFIFKMIPLLKEKDYSVLKRTADKLSGGQRHQLALAMALATEPSFIILDEPSAGLSPVAVESMYSLLSDVKESLGITIVLIEQNINKAISFCNRCILLSQGTIGREFSRMNTDNMRMEIMKELGL